MGWDQDVCRNSVRDFLLELMEIDVGKLIDEALHVKMGEVGLTYEEEEAVNSNGELREEGDGMYNVLTPRVLRLSDGRVFIETLVESTCGDDWGSDFYSFVEVGKTFEFTRNEHVYDMDGDGENRVVTTKEERISTFELPGPNIPERENNLPDPEDTVVSTAHNVLKPEVVFGPEGKKYSPDEIREQGGEFGDSIADFMQEQGLDHISFEPGDEEE